MKENTKITKSGLEVRCERKCGDPDHHVPHSRFNSQAKKSHIADCC